MNRDDIIRMALGVGLPHWYEDNTLVNESLVLKFASLVADAEREACAKVADGWSKRNDDVGAFIGKAIRARSNT